MTGARGFIDLSQSQNSYPRENSGVESNLPPAPEQTVLFEALLSIHVHPRYDAVSDFARLSTVFY